MNRRSAVIVALALVILAGLLWTRTTAPRATPADLPLARGTLANAWVIDGDTFDGTRADGTKVRVRILGIDAPEVAHDPVPADCGGDAAKRALIGLVDGRTVTIITDPAAAQTDRYGRTLAYVATAQIDDIGLRLLDDGMVEAWHPASGPPPARYPSYVVAQDAARTAGKGSWPTCGTLGR